MSTNIITQSVHGMHFIIVGSAIACRTVILLQRASNVIAEGGVYNPLYLIVNAYLTWFTASIASQYFLVVYATMCSVKHNILIADTFLYVPTFLFIGVIMNSISDAWDCYYPQLQQCLFSENSDQEEEDDTSIVGDSIADTSIADTSIVDTSIVDIAIADTESVDIGNANNESVDTTDVNAESMDTADANISTTDTNNSETIFNRLDEFDQPIIRDNN